MKFISQNLLISLALLCANQAFAGDTKYIFFGGAQSDKATLDTCLPGSNFERFAYPITSEERTALLKEINLHPNTSYVLVGHSSGSASAIEIASDKKLKNREHVSLVDLDGFSPREVPAPIRRVCWRAKNEKNLESRNYAVMTQENGCDEVHTQTATNCNTVWCLHFLLVNPSTPADLDESSMGESGYLGCTTKNLGWLDYEKNRRRIKNNHGARPVTDAEVK